MSAILLEQPLRLGILLVVLWGGLIAGWLVTQQDLWKRGALIGAVVAVGLMVANISINTEREQLDGFLSKLFTDIAKEGLPGTLHSIAPAYNHEEVDFALLKKVIKGRMGRWQFSKVERHKWSYTKVSKGVVDMTFKCRPLLQLGALPRPMDPSTWTLRLNKTGKRWWVTRITPIELTLPMNAGSATSLKQLMRR